MGEEETQLPNGLDWPTNKTVMYYNDSMYNGVDPPQGICWVHQTDKDGVPVRDSNGQLQRR